MLESLYVGATGMHAQQTNLDVIANNLANVNTAGFKKNKIDFEDLMYRTLDTSNVQKSPSSQYVGVGSAIASTNKIFSQGDIKNTDNQLDIAIQGNGFFELQLSDGSYAYTRNGSLQRNAEGYLTNSDGYLLNPAIQIPIEAKDITIQSDGKVSVSLSGESRPVIIGQVELASFINTSALTPLGDNLYQPNQETGAAYYDRPGENGFGALAQGFIESSNVELIDELLNLILAQRAYEINSRVVQSSDEMLGMVNNLRK